MEELPELHIPLRYPLFKLHPKGEDEDLLLFIVPRAHQIATLNGCHWHAGHQGHDCTLSFLQERFWWPGMVNQMRQVIKTCRHCLQYEGATPKAPLCPIAATAPLDLVHVDFTSIETTMDLDKSPRVANVWFSKTISLNMYWHM